MILQMHYNLSGLSEAADLTTVELSVAEQVDSLAGNLPWLDIGWPASPRSMLIPAGAPSVSFEFTADPTRSPLLGEFAAGVDASEGLILSGLLPHMHKLGRSFSLDLERAEGEPERIFEIQRWDFDWQSAYTFAEPLTLLPGDQLRMRCTFDNSAENQPLEAEGRRESVDVIWGEGSDDEMCTASLYVHGIAQGDIEPPAEERCAGSTLAPEGRLSLTSCENESLAVLQGAFFWAKFCYHAAIVVLVVWVSIRHPSSASCFVCVVGGREDTS